VKLTPAKFIIRPTEYKEAISKDGDCFIQFSRIDSNIESMIRKILRRYMQKHDTLYLNGVVIIIIKELVNNAVKANLKRLYFKLKSLDISKENEYQLGMQHFKKEVYESNSDNFFSLIEKSKLVVRVSFKIINNHLRIHVINNIPIHDNELKKIELRIQKAYEYDDISDAFSDVLDESEGAGLGLVLAILLFKNIGLDKKAFRINKKDKLTVATLLVPNKIVENETQTEITRLLLNEIDQLPTFPKNILEIQRLCSNPESTIKSISDRIKLDPALTANILKLANSAGYITIDTINDIESAVKIIGLKGISSLIVASGVHNIMTSRYKKFEEIWKQSTKAAFYAQKISIQVNLKKSGEHVYLATILSYIGKIILATISPDLEKSLSKILKIKGVVVSDMIEEVTIGMSNGTLGCKILEKWKFSETLCKTVEFHDRPYFAPEEFREFVYIIYLAISIMNIEDCHEKYEDIDEEVLDYLKINDRKTLETIHTTLFEAYKKQMEKE
jgi:HD-like signal output (HDOD) protein